VADSAGFVSRLNPDGSRDPDFPRVRCGAWVQALALRPNGKLLVAGNFLHINGVPRDFVAQLYVSSAPRFLADALSFQSNHSVLIQLTAPTTEQVVLEAAESLPGSWTPVATNNPGTTARVLLDPEAASRPMRFYRARSQ
jgi:hypothetical protein